MTRNTNAIARLFGIDWPIVLGPFGGMSSVALAGRVSDLGGLGSFGLYGYGADRIHESIAALRAKTDKPFAVNLWVPTGDEVGPAQVDLEDYTSTLAPMFDEVDRPLPTLPSAFLPEFDEQIAAVLEERPAAVSFVYGVPPADVVEAAHAEGIRVVGTATTVDEARALAAGGVDTVVANGAEAGGHRVSFLRPPEQSLVGSFSLIPQVADAVEVPVIAAGGVADGRGVRAAFALGASAVQVGTAFLRTRESAANPGYRQAIADADPDATVLTRAMSGRLARGIPNRAMRDIEASGRIAPFPAQNWLTGQFRAPAGRDDRAELQSLWAGQSASLTRYDDADDVFGALSAHVPSDDRPPGRPSGSGRRALPRPTRRA